MSEVVDSYDGARVRVHAVRPVLRCTRTHASFNQGLFLMRVEFAHTPFIMLLRPARTQTRRIFDHSFKRDTLRQSPAWHVQRPSC